MNRNHQAASWFHTSPFTLSVISPVGSGRWTRTLLNGSFVSFLPKTPMVRTSSMNLHLCFLKTLVVMRLRWFSSSKRPLHLSVLWEPEAWIFSFWFRTTQPACPESSCMGAEITCLFPWLPGSALHMKGTCHHLQLRQTIFFLHCRAMCPAVKQYKQRPYFTRTVICFTVMFSAEQEVISCEVEQNRHHLPTFLFLAPQKLGAHLTTTKSWNSSLRWFYMDTTRSALSVQCMIEFVHWIGCIQANKWPQAVKKSLVHAKGGHIKISTMLILMLTSSEQSVLDCSSVKVLEFTQEFLGFLLP